MTSDVDVAAADDERVAAFWEVAKRRAKLASLPGYFGPSALESLMPPSWSLSEDPAQADEFVDGLLEDASAVSAVPRADYEALEEPLPEVGALGIVLDGTGAPRALVVTAEVRVEGSDVVEVLRVLYSE